MDKDTVMSYIMNTPGNTNPNILGEMLSGMDMPIITVTKNGDEYVADKSFAEVQAIFPKAIVKYIDNIGYNVFVPIRTQTISNIETYSFFNLSYAGSGSTLQALIISIIVFSETGVTYSQYTKVLV